MFGHRRGGSADKASPVGSVDHLMDKLPSFWEDGHGWEDGPLVQEVKSVALTFERKKTVVTEVAEVAKGALSAIAAEYRGLSVDEMTNLRVEARNAGVSKALISPA